MASSCEPSIKHVYSITNHCYLDDISHRCVITNDLYMISNARNDKAKLETKDEDAEMKKITIFLNKHTEQSLLMFDWC